MVYKKANGVNLGFLVVVIVVMIVAVVVVVVAVAKNFCHSGDFVITNVISHLS